MWHIFKTWISSVFGQILLFVTTLTQHEDPHRMCLVCVSASDWGEESGGYQGGRMPEDPSLLIGHQAPALASDWLSWPHCSIPGRWRLKGGARHWSDNGAINLTERGSADGIRYIGGLFFRYPEEEDTRVKKRKMKGPAKLPQHKHRLRLLQKHRGWLLETRARAWDEQTGQIAWSRFILKLMELKYGEKIYSTLHCKILKMRDKILKV